MGAHTKGPWRAGGGTGCINQVAIEPTIGCAYGAGDEVEANARLMSAAPELLSELQAAHRLLSLALGCMTTAGQAKFARMSEIAGLGTDGATRHHERAAVIAKATGSAA